MTLWPEIILLCLVFRHRGIVFLSSSSSSCIILSIQKLEFLFSSSPRIRLMLTSDKHCKTESLAKPGALSTLTEMGQGWRMGVTHWIIALARSSALSDGVKHVVTYEENRSTFTTIS